MKIYFSSLNGTIYARAPCGGLPKEQVVALLGPGKTRAVCEPVAGHRYSMTEWVTEDPQTIGLIRGMCRDAELRCAAFNARLRREQRAMDARPKWWTAVLIPFS